MFAQKYSISCKQMKFQIKNYNYYCKLNFLRILNFKKYQVIFPLKIDKMHG